MININIYLSSKKYNFEIVPCIYEIFYKNDRYIILNENEKNIITTSNPIIGWMQNCLVCERYTSGLVNIDLEDNNNKIYFYICFKCQNEFNSYNFVIKDLNKNIFTKHHIDYKKINKTKNYRIANTCD